VRNSLLFGGSCESEQLHLILSLPAILFSCIVSSIGEIACDLDFVHRVFEIHFLRIILRRQLV
jgi:hypothetical protein